MLLSKPLLRRRLSAIIEAKAAQGHEVDGLETQLESLPDSYDALAIFGESLRDLPMRADWEYVEPNELEEIWAQCDPNRPRGVWREITPADAAARIETAFLSSVCGCVLGKPLEIHSNLAAILKAGETTGEWPFTDYVTEALLDEIGGRHESWSQTVRANIRFVAPDDDLNYSILGMLLLEQKGADFTKSDVRRLWMHHLPIDTTFGPERTMMVRGAQSYIGEEGEWHDPEDWANVWNPLDEKCGAQIRADAYGYACAGNPEMAATLAYRDASFSHRRTGIYATMWTAAAIAAAPVAKTPLEIFEIANQFVPQNSRFHAAVAFALEEVRQSSDWQGGHERLRAKYGHFGHCQVFFESGTLINTLHYAQNIGDGFCKQVMQGNDTDSYGATSGSILGMFFGPGHLEARWLAPFNDDIHTALAWFFERSLSTLAKRMGELPARLAAPLGAAL